MNLPITIGNGKGVTTINPADVAVTVGGNPVLVDSVNGATGQVVLHSIPPTCTAVKVSYWHKVSSSLFRGKAWITGKAGPIPSGAIPGKTSSGIILESDDIGLHWTIQDPQSGYDINAIYAADQFNALVVGSFSTIRHSINSGAIWSAQISNVLARQQQRVYNEGNINSAIFLSDDSINPNANIETTERVQVQYAIRIAPNTDPFNFPESGLGSQVILGIGPNNSGTFAYENMGPVSGDYSLWRAQCSNTVDGYCYAIPMFFVNRRNNDPYDPASNTNGSTTSAAIRPDLLTSDDVIEPDILDARRKITGISAQELLDENFEALLDGRLHTRLYRDTAGGDKYGTQILQVDRIAGSTSDGGTLIGASLDDAVDGAISSTVELTVASKLIAGSSVVPAPITLRQSDTPLNLGGVFHQNPAYFSAVYDSTSAQFNNRPIPGLFSGTGTDALTFTFSADANTLTQDPGLASPHGYHGYRINAAFVATEAPSALTYIPSEPKLIKNVNGNIASQTVYYQGVFSDATAGNVVEQWNSGLSGFSNFAVAFPGVDAKTPESIIRASTVEIHIFIKIDSSNSPTPNSIIIPAANFHYPVMTISKVNSITAGFSFKIQDISITDPIVITSAPGYGFIPDSVYEIVAMAKALANSSVKNGATVNFKKQEKSIGTFCLSDILTRTGSITGDIVLSTGTLGAIGDIIGVASTERIPAVLGSDAGLSLPFCWLDVGVGANIYPIKIGSISGTSITITVYNFNGTPFITTIPTTVVTLQVLIRQSQLLYNNPANTPSPDSLLIGYYYNPFQSIAELPESLTIKPVTRPSAIFISDLGTGGSLFEKTPFLQPLINIPTSDNLGDQNFYNIEPMVFSNFSIDSGFVNLPTYVPANLGESLTFSLVTTDNLSRSFYSNCSKEFTVITGGLKTGCPRKNFIAIVGRISSSTDNSLLKGEYILIIFSRNEFLDIENIAGFIADNKTAVAIYRLPNRPLARI
jgi:hypothetical protein